ncbi:MAG: hypothetical protein QOE86_3280, partial [Solirubrobacteraceae bacterium]|nr:hypothetical protein [Solirubrobacteraceae bacterium]
MSSASSSSVLKRTLRRVAGLKRGIEIVGRMGGRANRVAPVRQTVLHIDAVPGAPDALRGLPAGATMRIAPPLSDEEVHARLVAANLLHRRGLGARIYDARSLRGATAFAIEAPATGGAAAPAADRVLAGVDALVSDGLIEPAAADWRSPVHVTGANGDSRYAAPDLLRAADERRVVDAVLADAGDPLSVGREPRLRGSRHLYQAVPSVGAGGRGDSLVRWERMRSLMDSSAVTVRNRLVLDVGCNAGLMLAGALADGAAWGVGYDLPAVADHARDVLSALGFTRTDIVGAELRPGYPLAADVPAHAMELLDGCVILYLAIAQQIGFLEALGTIPWSAMVFEGGELQSMATLEDDLAPLRERTPFRIAGGLDHLDG